jgi:2-methylcitrate dehydratase PrpD
MTAAAPPLLAQLAAFVHRTAPDAVPAAVATSVRERMLDTLGLCLAALPAETSTQAFRMAAAQQGPSQATVVGWGTKLPAANAAFVNGVLAHTLDFDDTHLPSVLHPSASLVPTAWAVGEATRARVDDVIAAAAAGYEVCVRTGMVAYDRALGNSVFFERGWHATSICGTLASAAVAAKLYGLDAAGIGHAIAIAASMGSGIIEANRAGGSVKRLHCGWAAHAGITAADLARHGFTGPPTAFEGRFGFYQAFCGGMVDADALTRGLGDDWCVPGIFYKPYPANHFTHGGIDAARALRSRVATDVITDIELGVAAPTLRTIAEPHEEKIRPRSGYHAQFSGPFTVAAALIGGGGLGVWLDDFTDTTARDPRYLELAAKVRVVANDECSRIFPNQFPAILRISTADGRVHEARVMANRGGPDHPLTSDELLTKFRVNAGRVIPAADADVLGAAVLALDGHDMSTVMTRTTVPALRQVAAPAAVGVAPTAS